MEVEGKRAHSSGIFSENTGAGAIFEMSRILNEFFNDVRGEDFLTFNPGVILGGTTVSFDEAFSKGTAFGKSNVVSQTAVVDGGNAVGGLLTPYILGKLGVKVISVNCQLDGKFPGRGVEPIPENLNTLGFAANQSKAHFYYLKKFKKI